MRIFFAALILAFHSWCHFDCDYGCITGFVSMGAVAMTGFFLLSGFSNYYVYAGRALSRSREIKKFYWKRLISIIPAYYFGSVMYILVQGKETLMQNIVLAPIELLGIQNIFPNTFGLTHNGGTWFISCVLLCYLVFPYISCIACQLGIKTRVMIIGVLTCILLYSPLFVHYFKLGSIYDDPFIRGLEFSIGILLASLKNGFKKIKILTKPIAAVIELIILVVGLETAWRLEIGRGDYMLYSWIALPVFICMMITFSEIQIRDDKIIRYLSAISYDFFIVQLFNWPIMRTITAWIGTEDNTFKVASSFVVCLIFAVCIHELIEKPFKRSFERFI